MDRPGALAGVRPQIEALLEGGHGVHLGLGGRADEAAIAVVDLCGAYPKLSVGYAIARTDEWRGVAVRLRDSLADPSSEDAAKVSGPLSRPAAAGMAAALPPDEGVRAYLRQLDLDLVLLVGEDGPASFIADYASACRSLGLACAPLASTPEGARAQAAAPASAGAASSGAPSLIRTPALWTPALWATRAWDSMTRASDEDALAKTAGPAAKPGFAARLGDAYARRVFPGLAGIGARLAPASRPLLKARLERELDHGLLANEMSAEAAIIRAAQGEGPVVCGPWTGDPDLELLYWIPFLRWCRRRYKIDKERLVCVSGGDCAAWYEGLGTYLDLSELFEPEAQRALERDRRLELQRRGKKFGATDADRQIFRRLDRRLAFRGFGVLSPWVMHLLFERYWAGEAGPLFLAEHARHQPLKIKEKRARQLFPDLPQRYLAMSFEDAANFPDGPETRRIAGQLVRDAAQAVEVVVLVSEGRGGAPRSEIGEARGVRWIELDPIRAQGAGSAVVAAAAGFVGAQNWLAYVAGLQGKPAICVQAEPDARQMVHRATAAAACPFAPVVLEAGQADALAGVLASIAARDAEAGLKAAAAH